MPKCIIISGVRVCSGTTLYQVNSGKGRKVRKLSKARGKMRLAARRAITAMAIDPKQEKLAKDLLDAVMAATWDKDKAANAKDILRTVQLMLLDPVPKIPQTAKNEGMFTVIGY